ncbi:CKLF-like MARVEL transmembrane domain-containing protein 8 [Crotalus adamanteus]|uniref:CKLF-like MARVEL transmembrane domain-containing protein 8 n=1 Tax=Crotalus adamanteus TaxID=8729 RepID=A0AAW1B3B9_CROAD
MTYTRIPQVPWTTVGLYFNGSALLLYLIAAISEACAVTKELDYHNYNSWAASSFFAFVVASCYERGGGPFLPSATSSFLFYLLSLFAYRVRRSTGLRLQEPPPQCDPFPGAASPPFHLTPVALVRSWPGPVSSPGSNCTRGP